MYRELTPITSKNPATTERVCNYPGCGQPAAAPTWTDRPPEDCEGPRPHQGHRVAGTPPSGRCRSRDHHDRGHRLASDPRPVTGAKLLRLLRAEADRVEGIAGQFRDAIATLTDPTAPEAEVEAARAAAEQRAAAPEARAATVERQAA